MPQVPGPRAGFTVQCVLCGRTAGEVVGGRFRRDQRFQAPRIERGIARCGECGGNLYLEPGLAQLAPAAGASAAGKPDKGLQRHVGGHAPAGPAAGGR
jgi:hypothetical protein